MVRKKQPRPTIREFSEQIEARDSLEGRREREHKLLESVGYRKVRAEDLERQALAAEADRILREADHATLEALAANVQALCDGMAALKLPSNDPQYLERLQQSDRVRAQIAERIVQIDIVADGGKSYLGVGSFTHGDARALAELLSTHLEAKVRVWSE